MIKKLIIFFIAFNLIFYAGSTYAKVFLYTNGSGVTYLVRDKNYNPNSKYAITVKYSNIAHAGWYDNWGHTLHDGLIKIPINKSYYVYVNKNSIEEISYRTHGTAWPVDNFHDGLAQVGSQFINKQAKIVFRTKFKYTYFNFHEGLAAVVVEEDHKLGKGDFIGKWGFIDKTGKLVIPAEFQNVNDIDGFHEGLVGVKINGKWGFIDKEGVLIIPNKFENVSSFHDGIANVELNGNYNYCINKRGRIVIPNKYTNTYWRFLDPTYGMQFNQGLAPVGLKINGKWEWGYINKKGKFVIPHKFEYASGFNEGLALVEINGKVGFINRHAAIIVPAKFEAVNRCLNLGGIYGCSFHDGLAPVEMNGKWGYINKKGNLIIPYKFKNAFSFHDGLAMVKLPGSKLRFQINKKGKIVIPMESNVPFKIIY